jgi:hypothetical protein
MRELLVKIANGESKEAQEQLSPEEIRYLQHALDEQLTARPPEQVAATIQNERLRNDIARIGRGETTQRENAMRGAFMGGIAGGAGGAGLGAMRGGIPGILAGAALGALPGAVSGYWMGKRKQRREELGEALADYRALDS